MAQFHTFLIFAFQGTKLMLYVRLNVIGTTTVYLLAVNIQNSGTSESTRKLNQVKTQNKSENSTLLSFSPSLLPKAYFDSKNFVSMKVSKIRGDKTVKGWKQSLKQRNIRVFANEQRNYLFLSFLFFILNSEEFNYLILLSRTLTMICRSNIFSYIKQFFIVCNKF